MHVLQRQPCLPSTSAWHGLPGRCSQRPTSVRCTCKSSQRGSQHPVHRRHLMMSIVATPFLLAPREPLSEAAQIAKLPKGYEEFARKLISALQDAIEADLSDMEERQVRRKADPAKNLVKGWIQDWKNRSEVEEQVSYKELSGVIRQLGDFYKTKGVRSRLPRALGDELLAKLNSAQNSLPLPASADGKQKA